MMYDDSLWGYWMMGLGLLAVVLVIAGIAVAVVLAGRPRRSATPPAGTTRHTSTEALHELDLRFARGEIDEQSYERSRSVLERPAR